MKKIIKKWVSRVIALFSAFLLYILLVIINFYFFDANIKTSSFWGLVYYAAPCMILYRYIRKGGWWAKSNDESFLHILINLISMLKPQPKPSTPKQKARRKKQISNMWGIPPKKEDTNNKKAIAKKIKQDQGLKEQKESKKPKKKTTSKLTDDQKHWLGLVEMRVNSLPFDFIKRTYTVDSLGEAHFGEYKVNEPQVPEDKREEVALARVEGLSSIRDYIQVNGSKEQKFHLDSSIIGALLYASSLGINVDKYEI